MADRSKRFSRVMLGAFVVIGAALFVFALLQANAVREWLNPSKQLRLVLPDAGLFGLREGADIEILGTQAGKVTQIVIDPNEKIHAEAKIDPDMAAFVRRDSKAIIRKTFGVAGDAYLDITRGYGEEMDWEYAVLRAEQDRAPTDSIGEMLEDVRSRVMPILAQTERAITALADLTESLANPDGHLQGMLTDVRALTARIERGDGSLGRLLSSDRTAQDFDALLSSANQTMAAFGPILAEIQTTANQIAALSSSINAQSKDLPAINRRVNSILASLDDVLVDLRQTSPQLPKITKDVSVATANVPVLLGMTQQTLVELNALLRQLRNNWLLGGGGDAAPGDGRLPAGAVRP
ncbi:MAG: MCE family protein [Chromatiaceae bacterium]|nr:MCE family protein [Gammaproteobacteria bacterium]MCP5305657.1 MCE family protein [Chromatiaceae bacterium]MCP5312514.1 MCE family protein [Chromatiaceae bacterium]